MHPNSRYDAYGAKINGTGAVENKYLFAGEQYDSNLGDYYLRARYYADTNGRFLKKDDYEGDREEPGSLHKYLYANGNPVSFIDPSGFYSLQQGNDVHDAIGEDFINRSGGNVRRYDQNFRGGNRLTIKRILREADGLANGFPGFNGRRVDLADYTEHQFYEIKPRRRFLEGVEQELEYLFILNLAPKQTTRWHIGRASNYVPNPAIVLPDGDIALVVGPVLGVITYEIISPKLTLAVAAASAAITATFLTALIIEQIALKRGLAFT